jgi:hypothetical protein
METLYPMFYGTRMVTMSVLRATFEPHMHPEYARRLFAWIEDQNGRIGIGGGYRPPNTQPDKPGFAPEGKSFHQDQAFPSGIFYSAVDLVAVNDAHPYTHRSPKWPEVPEQDSLWAAAYGVHANVSTEPWHMQGVPIDGYDSWVAGGRKDLVYGYKMTRPTPEPPIKPPIKPPVKPPAGERRITVFFKSKVLERGSKGPDVKFYQRLLNDYAGQQLKLDGIFGLKMEKAVKNWQGYFKIKQTGKLDRKTQRSLIEIALITS